MKVPLVDLKVQYKSIKKEIDKAISEVIDKSAFIGGPNNKFNNDFEKAFAKYAGRNYCVGCGNGTDALEIAIKALGIGRGDEVIVPAMTWISTSEAVGNCGALPVFVDVDPDFYTIDPSKIEKAITKKTKAIIPVHYYGMPAAMDKIMKIASKHKLLVIEDCAQAHGATFRGKKVGTFGDIATFSFFPSKNLGAYGDAGCITTNDERLALKARKISNHGMVKRHEHEFEGRNSRLDGLQAAILSVKLKYLEKWNKNRISNAKKYSRLIKGVVKKPNPPAYARHVYHVYVIEVDNREKFRQFLMDNGIETSVHYPKALPYLETYKDRGFGPKDFPVAKRATERIVSLPMFGELNDAQIKYVSQKINEFRGEK